MKKINRLIIPVVASVLMLGSCKKGFEEVNTNPYSINNLDPAFLFTNAERQVSIGGWENEQVMVQQTTNAYNLGTAGYSQLFNNDTYNRTRFNDNYNNVIKPLVQILALTKDKPAQSNLYNMARIWKAYTFMILVDTYGDVPYFEAGKGFLEGINYPKYDKDEVIYEDLYKELKAATAALSPDGGYVRNDIFFGPTGTATNQVAQWKKTGYSLMLRLGMRYTSSDAAKAASIVQEAVAGGVMQTNADDVKITQYNANFNNPQNVNIRTINPYFYYLAEPFATFLRTNKDPRAKYLGANYADPKNVNTVPDTTTANIFGFPIGYDQSITAATYPGYRGTKGDGQNYTQLNYTSAHSATAPTLLITNAQTKLLLAEARVRGYIATGTAQDFYESGIIAAMDQFELYPGKLTPAVTAAEKTTYLLKPDVAWTGAITLPRALELINTQYWITSFGNGVEAFANFRRTEYPTLTPPKYKGVGIDGGGFFRRTPYPLDEASLNPTNYAAAVASLGGNTFSTRVFWDVTTKVQ